MAVLCFDDKNQQLIDNCVTSKHSAPCKGFNSTTLMHFLFHFNACVKVNREVVNFEGARNVLQKNFRIIKSLFICLVILLSNHGSRRWRSKLL